MEELELRKSKLSLMVQLYYKRISSLQSEPIEKITKEVLDEFLDTSLSMEEINDILAERFMKKEKQIDEITDSEEDDEDIIYIYHDEDDETKMYVDSDFATRFHLEPLSSKGKLSEIDNDDVQYIEVNADNQYSPYKVRHVKVNTKEVYKEKNEDLEEMFEENVEEQHEENELDEKPIQMTKTKPNAKNEEGMVSSMIITTMALISFSLSCIGLIILYLLKL